MKRNVAPLIAATLALICLAGCAPQSADLVLLGGKVVTVDPTVPDGEALAARDGRIVAVGTDEEMRRLIGEGTEVIELDGSLVIPGFIESHGHFTGIGRFRMVHDLREARTWDEIVSLVAAEAARAEPDEWIIGWGWHQEKWDRPPARNVDGYPTHHELSRVAPNNPVLLKHAAGTHAGIVNARALELHGIDENTPDPSGGNILRDEQGHLTGVLREAAYEALNNAAEEALGSRTKREIELAGEECLAKGITTFQDAGSELHEIDTMRDLAEAGKLAIRLWVMIDEDNETLEQHIARYRMVGAGDHHLTVRALKGEIDGALGSHTAWMLEPYTDVPATSGLNTNSLEVLERKARIAFEHEFQLAVHAIGDRGSRETLDLFQRTFEANPGEPDLRWRVEHAQHLSPEDIPRFAELGVIASMQGIHCTSDGPWVEQRLGPERARNGAYVWRALIDAGATVCNGTDAPVEDVDPIANFHATVTRSMRDGNAFHPDQVMTRREALESYTIHAAYAGFEDDLKGTLTPGKFADVTVLSQDILTVPAERILDTEVLYTIVGGQVRYRADGVGG